MAGSSMVFQYEPGNDGDGSASRYRRVIADWVSDDSAGTASATTRKIAGELIKIVTDPSGTAAPSDNWDVVLTDDKSVDLSVHLSDEAKAALIARDTANNEETYLVLEDSAAGALGIAAFPVVSSPITIAVANAGNSKAGQIILYYRV